MTAALDLFPPEPDGGWVDVCGLGDLLPDRGVAALVDGEQVALFRLSAGSHDSPQPSANPNGRSIDSAARTDDQNERSTRSARPAARPNGRSIPSARRTDSWNENPTVGAAAAGDRNGRSADAAAATGDLRGHSTHPAGADDRLNGVSGCVEPGSAPLTIGSADETVFAVGNYDPLGGAYVLSRGLVGSRGDRNVVFSPLYKQAYDLATGRCLDDPDVAVPTYPVRVRGGRIEVALRPEARG